MPLVIAIRLKGSFYVNHCLDSLLERRESPRTRSCNDCSPKGTGLGNLESAEGFPHDIGRNLNPCIRFASTTDGAKQACPFAQNDMGVFPDGN